MASYRIYSWNVNGIRAATRKGLDTWMTGASPDILCLQEIKATSSQIPKKLTAMDYHVAVHSAQRKGYSGVATFSRAEPSEVRTSMGQEEFDDEGRLLLTRYPEFVLFNVYFPNGKKDRERLDYKMRFYDRFKEICRLLIDDGEKVVVCGDVNTAHKEQDLAHPKPNSKYSGFLPKERKWIDQFLSIGFSDSFRHLHGDGEGDYTWWTMRSRTARQKNVGWRLDYFFVSDNLLDNLGEASIHREVEGSDHCPVSIRLDF